MLTARPRHCRIEMNGTNLHLNAATYSKKYGAGIQQIGWWVCEPRCGSPSRRTVAAGVPCLPSRGSTVRGCGFGNRGELPPNLAGRKLRVRDVDIAQASRESGQEI